MKKLKTFEAWSLIPKKKSKEIETEYDKIQPEGSLFFAMKSEDFNKKSKSMRAYQDDYVVCVPPNFVKATILKISKPEDQPNYFLLKPISNDLFDKVIKVPSIERALMYLTDLKIKQTEKEREDSEKYDDEIE
jgi:hypothetical protein